MAITVPVVGTEISASAFGVPVANAVNSLGSVKSIRPLGITIASGANTAILSATYTVPATVAGLAYIITVTYTTTGAGDLLSGGSVIAGLPAGSGAVVTANGVLLKSGNTATVNFRIYAWGGASITVDANKSVVTFQTVATVVSGDVFP